MPEPPDFVLAYTDGDATHLPTTHERNNDYKTSDEYQATQKALVTFATEIVRKLGRRYEKGQTYTKIPEGYSVWACQRGGHRDEENPKLDWYIYGHPNHKKFDSFAQFAIHINHLQLQFKYLQLQSSPQSPPQSPPRDCSCKVCVRFPISAQKALQSNRQDPVPASITTPSPSKDQNPLKAQKGETSEEESSSMAPPTGRRNRPQNNSQPVGDGTMQSGDDAGVGSSTGRRSRNPQPVYDVTGEDADHATGADSDASLKAGHFSREDSDEDYDGGDDTEDGARKRKRSRQGGKRASSSKAASKKPKKRFRLRDRDGEHEDQVEIEREGEGVGAGDARVERPEDELVGILGDVIRACEKALLRLGSINRS